ncbi:MAG: phosphatase PAP2 family protein [Brevibacillus sp.]|nr:phosphatase PAP2 family protein [Brevibacillus sp.]
MLQKTPGVGYLIAGSAVCLLMFAIAALLVHSGSTDGVDRFGYGLITSFIHPIITGVMKAASYLGEAKVIAVLAVCFLTAAIWLRRFVEVLALALLLLLGEGLNDMLKEWFARPRPSGLNLVELPLSYSFPSGHAMVSSSFYLFLAYLACRLYGNRRLVRLWVAASIVIVLLMCMSRVYLGVHYTSDVLAGMALGWAWLLLVIAAYETLQHRFSQPPSRSTEPISSFRE